MLALPVAELPVAGTSLEPFISALYFAFAANDDGPAISSIPAATVNARPARIIACRIAALLSKFPAHAKPQRIWVCSAGQPSCVIAVAGDDPTGLLLAASLCLADSPWRTPANRASAVATRSVHCLLRLGEGCAVLAPERIPPVRSEARLHVDVRIGDLVIARPVADHQQQDILTRSVDEPMSVRCPLRKAGAAAGLERLLAGIGLEDHRA